MRNRQLDLLNVDDTRRPPKSIAQYDGTLERFNQAKELEENSNARGQDHDSQVVSKTSSI